MGGRARAAEKEDEEGRKEGRKEEDRQKESALSGIPQTDRHKSMYARTTYFFLR